VKKILSATKIYVSESKLPDGGRGVFAESAICSGEIIERCPIIEIPEGDLASLGESVLVNYFYFFGKNKEVMLIALGFGSIYNHTYTPNARYKIKPKEQVIEFMAVKNIKKNEEITVNYVPDNPQNLPLWFED